MRLYVSLAASIVIALAVLAACNSNEPNKSQGGSTTSEPSARSNRSSSSSTRAPGAFGASSTPNPAALTPLGGEPARITPAEVISELARNNAFIVDVRGEAAYKEVHIKGAVLIPATEILEHTNELPRNKFIITYCS